MSTRARLLYLKGIALALHGDQTYGPFPYEFHLQMNVDLGRKWVTDAMLAWAGITREQFETGNWFHDTGEDTSATRRLLQAILDAIVEEAVWTVTDVPGKNRKARKWGTPTNPGPMVKIPENRFGLLLKLVDRLANASASKAARDKLPAHMRKKDKYAMYQEEQPGFYAQLYVRDTPVQALWDKLNEVLEYDPA